MDYSQAIFTLTALIKCADVATVALVWCGCWYLRFSAWIPVTKGIPSFERYSQATLPLALIALAVFHMVGAYRRDRIRFGFRALKKVAQGAVLSTFVFLSFCYFTDRVDYSRIYLLLFLAVVTVALIAERVLIELAWHIAQNRIVRPMRILVIGSGDLLEMYVDKIRARRPYPIEWVGHLTEQETSKLGLRKLGCETDIRATLSKYKTDLAVVSYPPSSEGKYREILEVLGNEMVNVKVVPDYGRYSTFTYQAEHECGIPLLVFNQVPTGATDRVLKRFVDIVGCLVALVLFSPVLVIASLWIRFTSPGPVVFRQQRMGADGKLFMLYKFRTMREDAEKHTGAVWAVENDPRTTSIGRWLRGTSLDELPQLFNVLRGDMSLVGPRPERPVFVEQFRDQIPRYMLRHKMKSGMTGWAQINGWRGNTSLEERIKHDLYYIGHWSHWFDIKILVLTAWKGFVHRHAY